MAAPQKDEHVVPLEAQGKPQRRDRTSRRRRQKWQLFTVSLLLKSSRATVPFPLKNEGASQRRDGPIAVFTGPPDPFGGTARVVKAPGSSGGRVRTARRASPREFGGVCERSAA
ncbi:hypothetical protein COCON_G00148950 [Conger conger]|uniref:Uncharacterized protein n=1 Tax=Conger conger TaxID=82655 RepID=A0A9Q1DC90_CONCO|nr:hypothetical protein COCON_G00148950 [Conger conger]